MTAEERAERVAYVQALLDYARDDARQVYIRVTATLGIATLFVTQLPFKNLQALTDFWTGVLFVGLFSMIASAGLYFLFVAATHHERREIAKFLLDVERVKPSNPNQRIPVDQVLTDLWDSRKRSYHLADGLFAFGGLLLVLALAKMILGPILLGS